MLFIIHTDECTIRSLFLPSYSLTFAFSLTCSMQCECTRRPWSVLSNHNSCMHSNRYLTNTIILYILILYIICMYYFFQILSAIYIYYYLPFTQRKYHHTYIPDILLTIAGSTQSALAQHAHTEEVKKNDSEWRYDAQIYL